MGRGDSSAGNRLDFLQKTAWRVGLVAYLLRMFLRVALGVVFVATVASAIAAGPALPKPVLVAAAVESANDNIGSGWCGRGMLSILRNAGLGAGLQGNNGQDWEKNLLQAGWKPIPCSSPMKAPLGSVLVYVGDARVGKRPRGTPGGYFGHVEMVALGREGQRLYVSDSPRPLPGGTVRDNFTGRAWLPPGSRSIFKAVPVEQQVAAVLEERTRMAMEHFGRSKTEFTALNLKEETR